MKSYEQKILAWDGADFHELAASMDQEEIRSDGRGLWLPADGGLHLHVR